MARPLRIEYEGAFYHITARGNERKSIFLSRADYEKFLSCLKEAALRYSIIIHCYVLMGNHYHLLIETLRANLSAFMHALQSGYTTYFNRKRHRSGHLFQGRYKSLLIDKDVYLLELSRYIHLNPVTAHMTARSEDYRYSSYHAYLNPREDTGVYRDLILSMSKGIETYRSFVESGLSEPTDPFKDIYGGMILGRKSFIKDTLSRLDNTQRQETSHRRQLHKSSDLDDILGFLSDYYHITKQVVITTAPYRNYALYLAKKCTPLSNPDIGVAFGNITYSAVAKAMQRLSARMSENQKLRKELEGLEHCMSTVKG
jgi:putative transposase